MKLDDALGLLGKAALYGWGDQVLLGIALGFLDTVDPNKCYQYIVDNRSLIDGISDDQWEAFRNLAQKVKVKITIETVVDGLRRGNPEILSVIINTPGGMEWLGAQIDAVKTRLAIP